MNGGTGCCPPLRRDGPCAGRSRGPMVAPGPPAPGTRRRTPAISTWGSWCPVHWQVYPPLRSVRLRPTSLADGLSLRGRHRGRRQGPDRAHRDRCGGFRHFPGASGDVCAPPANKAHLASRWQAGSVRRSWQHHSPLPAARARPSVRVLHRAVRAASRPNPIPCLCSWLSPPQKAVPTRSPLHRRRPAVVPPGIPQHSVCPRHSPERDLRRS